jgi:Rieske Fe-S protein
MPGEDQERFEDYLELEHFIAELQAGHVAHPPQELTPERARIYRLALLFHSATSGGGEPSQEFAEQLQTRLEEALLTQQNEPEQTVSQAPAPTPLTKPRKHHIPRRSLLTGGAIAAASALVGAGIGYVAEKSINQTSGVIYVADVHTATDWFPVINVAELGNQAVKFVSEPVVGYIVRYEGTDDDRTKQGQIIAMSAACTHRGCIVQWSGSDRKYHCPCHGGVFTEDGDTDHDTSSLYLNSLPRLDVKVENGKIYVRMSADA